MHLPTHFRARLTGATAVTAAVRPGRHGGPDSTGGTQLKTRTRVAVAIFAGAGIIAAGGGGAALAQSGTPATHATASTPAATAKTPRYVVLDCSYKPVVAPSSLIVTCADAGIGLRDLHWTSWTPKLASGYGTFWENDCTPNCAEGHFHSYPSLEMLWGSAAVKGHPADRRYTELTVIFTGKTRPPVYVLKNGKVVATYPLTQTFPAI
jgi:hypothetical protein